MVLGEIRAVGARKAAVSEAILEHAGRSRGFRAPTNLLLVDEVDRLKMSGLEQLRAIFDRGGIGLVMIGMPGLERRLAERSITGDTALRLGHFFGTSAEF